MNCSICFQPLGPLELTLGHKWHIDCQKCSICNGELNIDGVQRCLDKEIIVSHSTCYDQRMNEELKRRPVTITQELLDWHNERRLIFDINGMLTANANMTIASTNFRNSRWIHELSLDDLYLVMKRLEACAAEASIILSESKQKEKIKKDRDTRDKDLLKASAEGRVTEQREKEIKRNRFTPDEKAIKAMMSYMSREAAVESLTKEKVKKLMKEHADWDETRARQELESPTVN